MVNKKDKKFSIISFLIPAFYRFVLELLYPEFPLGYDTNTSYIYHIVQVLNLQRDLLSFFDSAPLYYYILYLLAKVVGIIIAIKILAVILSGLLGYSIYKFYLAQNYLNENEACEASLLTFFYFVVLRLTWDFHRNILALFFVFMSIYYLGRKNSLSYLFGILSSLSNQLSFPFIFSYSLPELLKKNKNYLMLNIISGTSWFIIIFLRIKTYFNSIVVGSSYSVPLPFPVGLELLKFTIWAFAPLFIPVLMSIKKAKKIRLDTDIVPIIYKHKKMLSFFIIPLITAFFTILGYRLIIVTAIPLSYLVFVLSDRRKLYRSIVIILAVNYTISPVLDGLTIYPIPDPSLSIWGPTGMLQGSLYFRDIRAARVLFSEAKHMLNKSTALVIHDQLISAAYTAGINLTAENIIIKKQFTDFKIILYNLLENYTVVLVIWFLYNSTFLWMDILKSLGINIANTTCDIYGYMPDGYIIIAKYDRMALYVYSNRTLIMGGNSPVNTPQYSYLIHPKSLKAI